MSPLEDGERMRWVNSGISMESLRLSRTISGRLTLLTSNQMVDHQTLDVLQPTQDGGNSSDTKV
jgi:hypothetical protein